MPAKKVIIIGAGASGLAAACAAAEAGAAVTVLEKNHVPGRKILSTGAGKCNLSNTGVKAQSYHGGAAGFAARALKALPPGEVLEFFGDLGLLLRTEPDGRIFPRSQKASDVVGVLVNRLQEKGAELALLTCAEAIKRTGGGFEITARKVTPKWDKRAEPGPAALFRADAVILAAGGPAYPRIGGTAAGLELARALGHKVREPRPAITPLTIKGKTVRELDGIRVEAGLSLYSGAKLLASERGEILFTDYGISGPPVLSLSIAAGAALARSAVACRLDLFPDLSREALFSLLAKRRDAGPARPWKSFLCGLAEERTLALLSALLKIAPAAPAGSVKDPLLSQFAGLLKGWELEVTGTRDFEDAMAADGGVDTAEISPGTFESRLVRNLFITGELLDLVGDCGGYNLHFAWTSGLLAGLNASK